MAAAPGETASGQGVWANHDWRAGDALGFPWRARITPASSAADLLPPQAAVVITASSYTPAPIAPVSKISWAAIHANVSS